MAYKSSRRGRATCAPPHYDRMLTGLVFKGLNHNCYECELKNITPMMWPEGSNSQPSSPASRFYVLPTSFLHWCSLSLGGSEIDVPSGWAFKTYLFTSLGPVQGLNLKESVFLPSSLTILMLLVWEPPFKNPWPNEKWKGHLIWNQGWFECGHFITYEILDQYNPSSFFFSDRLSLCSQACWN